MLVAYVRQVGPAPAHGRHGGIVPDAAVWMDLVSPATLEDKIVERAVGVEIPTRDEMSEIEASSGSMWENGARYMTLSVLCGGDTDSPEVTPLTFILTTAPWSRAL